MPFQFKLSKRLAISHAVSAAGVLTLLACTPDRSIVGPAPSDAPGVPIESLLTQKNFGSGDRVKVINGTLNVRAAATITGTLLGTQVVGNLGTIIGGPVYDSTGDKLWRWKVDFDQGADGWAADYYLTLVLATPVASVAVAPANVSVRIGGTAQLAATVKDSLGNVLTGRVITWTSSNPSAASISAAGLLTGVAAGSATITASAGGKAGIAAASVATIPVASIAVTPATAMLYPATTVQLAAVTKDSAGNVLANRAVTWTSSNAAAATVSASGLVSGVAAGLSTITATSEGQAATAAMTVQAVPVASVSLTPATALVYIGKTLQLNATPRDSAGNALAGRTITWATSNSAVATVSSSGLVSGVAAGGATITATSGGKSASASVTVALVPVAAVAVAPAAVSLTPAATQQLTATTKDSAGNTLTGRTITWATNNAAAATVSASGLVTAVAPGTATITATSEGTNGSASVAVSSTTVSHAGWFVSPAGSSSGSGSISSPWSLTTALAGGNGKVAPGDTIWLRGGTYSGTAYRSTLTGTAGAPIVVRQYPGERAILDAVGATSSTARGDFFVVAGSYAVYWGFELMDSDPNRSTTTRPNMVVNNGPHNKYVNLVVHDGGIGFYTYAATATDIEVTGGVFFNNGWQGTTEGGGHALYLKADVGPLVARDNIEFNQFGYGTQVYSNLGDGHLNNITLDGNVAFNNGALSTQYNSSGNANLLIGGQEAAQQCALLNNMTYFSPGIGVYNVVLGLGTYQNSDLTFANNYMVGGSWVLSVGAWTQLAVSGNTVAGSGGMARLKTSALTGYQWTGNAHWRSPTASAWEYVGGDVSFAGWQSATGLGLSDVVTGGSPSGAKVFVRPNAYEPGRANIVVYNWNGAGSVNVDLSGVLAVGDRYEVRNAQDFFGTPVASGTYGGSITLPTGGVTPPTPIGGAPNAAPRTGPVFDVFVVTRAN